MILRRRPTGDKRQKRAGSREYARKDAAGKPIVVRLADTGERYVTAGRFVQDHTIHPAPA